MAGQKHRTPGTNSGSWTAWFGVGRLSDEPEPTGGLSNLALLWIFVGVAFLARAVVLLQLANNHPSFDQPIVDSRWHYLWAKQIAAGDWLGSEVYFRAPLYPYLLGIWIKLFGDGLWPIRLMQAFIGGLTAGLTFLIGQRAFGRKVGVLSGIMIALYGTLIYYETELLIEVIAVPLGLWAVLLSMQESSRPTPRLCRWLGIGVVIGLFAIARPNILLVVPAFWWWAWPRVVGSLPPSLMVRIKAPLILTLGVLLPIGPVTVRNYVVAQDPVLISYQGGINLWLGNNPNADGVTMQMPEVPLDESIEWDEFVRTTDSIASGEAGRSLSASEVSSFWTRRALGWMTDNPVATLRGWTQKTWYFLSGFEVSDQTDIYAFAQHSPVLSILISRRAIYLPFGLIAPFALLGLIFVWKRSAETRPLIGFIALYALTVILFLATARHRLPVVPILVVSAAAAIIRFAGFIREKRYNSLILPVLLLVVLAVFLNQRHLERMLSNPAFLHYQTALAFERQSDFESAAMEYEKALAVEPNHLASRKNLAYALVRLGAYDSAVAMSFSYLRHRQQDAEAYNNIGLAYLGQGDTTRAEASFRTAIRNNPKLPHPYWNLAEVAWARQDGGAALIRYSEAISADSTFASAYNGLAIVFASMTNYEEAEQLLLTGLRHVPDHAILQANLGSVYLKLEKPAQALPYLERALYWQPQSVGIRINLALVHLSLRQVEPAVEQLRQVLRIDPNNATATRLLEEIDRLGENL